MLALSDPLDVSTTLQSGEQRRGVLCFEAPAQGPWFMAFNPDWTTDNGVFFQL